MSNIRSFFFRICFYRRYVDNVFCIFNGSSEKLHGYFYFLNTLHHSISFTMELDCWNTFYLFSISWFQRKKQNQVFYIPQTYQHRLYYSFFFKSPLSLKKTNSLKYFFHKFFDIPHICEPNFNKETYLDQNNNDFIINPFKKIINLLWSVNKNLTLNEAVKKKKYFTIPYLGPIYLQLWSLFKPYGITICLTLSRSFFGQLQR